MTNDLPIRLWSLESSWRG